MVGNAVGDGFDQLPLLLEKRTLVRLRHLRPVGDFHAADRLALHDDVGALHPRSGRKIRRLDYLLLEEDSRLAVVRVLPAWR